MCLIKFILRFLYELQNKFHTLAFTKIKMVRNIFFVIPQDEPNITKYLLNFSGITFV